MQSMTEKLLQLMIYPTKNFLDNRQIDRSKISKRTTIYIANSIITWFWELLIWFLCKLKLYILKRFSKTMCCRICYLSSWILRPNKCWNENIVTMVHQIDNKFKLWAELKPNDIMSLQLDKKIFITTQTNISTWFYISQ